MNLPLLPLPPPGARLRLVVDAVDDEGRGRAQVLDESGEEQAGYDVAVRGGCVGDEVDAIVERIWAKRRLVQARVRTVVQPGDARDETDCPHGLPCAGCPLEGWAPGAAIAFKRARLLRALEDAELQAPVDDVLLAEHWYGRRQRTKLVIADIHKEIRLGLYAPHSHRLLAANHCPHLRAELREACAALHEALSKAAPEERAHFKALIVRSFEEGAGVVLVSSAPLSDELWADLEDITHFSSKIAAIRLRVDDSGSNSLLGGEHSRSVGPARLTPLEGGPPVDLDAFCQPDPELARTMYALVADWLCAKGTEGWALDAYAGTGGFARALLAGGYQHVVAVERAEPPQETLSALQVQALALSVGEGLAQLEGRESPTAIVADPPRRGLAEDAERIAALGALRFALVSCDPDAMARDLKVLTQAGYRIERILPVDLFGGSAAIEAISFLERAT